MSRGVISFIVALGAGAWLYAQFQRHSGNNTRQSVIAAGVSALVIFIILLVILGMVLK